MKYIFHKAPENGKESTSDTLIIQVNKKKAFIFNKSWLSTNSKKPHETDTDYSKDLDHANWRFITREEALKFLITVGATMP